MIQGRTVASDSPAGVFLPNGSQYRPLCIGDVRKLKLRQSKP